METSQRDFEALTRPRFIAAADLDLDSSACGIYTWNSKVQVVGLIGTGYYATPTGVES